MIRQKKDHAVYLQDIVTAITKIHEYTREGKAAFFADGKTQDAVIRQLSIIGEACAKLPPSFKAKYPKISWRKITGMRNIIIHDYSETDMPTVWIVVERDLPFLEKEVKIMLKERK